MQFCMDSDLSNNDRIKVGSIRFAIIDNFEFGTEFHASLVTHGLRRSITSDGENHGRTAWHNHPGLTGCTQHVFQEIGWYWFTLDQCYYTIGTELVHRKKNKHLRSSRHSCDHHASGDAEASGRSFAFVILLCRLRPPRYQSLPLLDGQWTVSSTKPPVYQKHIDHTVKLLSLKATLLHYVYIYTVCTLCIIIGNWYNLICIYIMSIYWIIQSSTKWPPTWGF